MLRPQDLFAALSDETRLRCLVLLDCRKEVCVCEFCDVLVCSQPKVSRHLSHLRRVGIVVDERRGQWVYYRLNAQLEPWIKSIVASALKSLAKQEPYLSDLNKLTSACVGKPCG